MPKPLRDQGLCASRIPSFIDRFNTQNEISPTDSFRLPFKLKSPSEMAPISSGEFE